MATTDTKKRIAKNTMLLYVRMILTLVVSLYTSRIILSALGVVDYGIYNAVAGFIILFSSLTNSFSAAIARFITFELGRGENTKELQLIFSSSVTLQFILGVIILILAETIGVWFLNNEMTIPSSRLFAANCVFQFSLITLFINLLSVPYNATIIAKEKMGTFAFVGIFEASLNLIIAFIILYVEIDNLILYSFLMCLSALSIRILYSEFCRRNFSFCRFSLIFNRKLLLQLSGFAGWNFIGASSAVLRDQGINVLLNIFCGASINAARGISMHVSSAVSRFSNNFIVAINPQITKFYASGDREHCFDLVFLGSKFSFFLMLILSVPIYLETPYLLSLWLVEVPDYTVIFVRLILINLLVESVSHTMVNLMLATGNIRNYQILVGGIQMLNFPLAFLLLKLNFGPESTLYLSILLAFCCLFLRLYMLAKMIGFPASDFMQKILMRDLLVICFIYFFLFLLTLDNSSCNIYTLMINLSLSLVITLVSIYFFGCNSNEKNHIKNFILKRLRNANI